MKGPSKHIAAMKHEMQMFVLSSSNNTKDVRKAIEIANEILMDEPYIATFPEARTQIHKFIAKCEKRIGRLT